MPSESRSTTGLSAAELVAALSEPALESAPGVPGPGGWCGFMLAVGAQVRNRWYMPKEQHYLLILLLVGHLADLRTGPGESPPPVGAAELSALVGFSEPTIRTYCKTLVAAGALVAVAPTEWVPPARIPTPPPRNTRYAR